MSIRYEIARRILLGESRKQIQAAGVSLKHYAEVAQGLEAGTLHVSHGARTLTSTPKHARIMDFLARGLPRDQIANEPSLKAEGIKAEDVAQAYRLWRFVGSPAMDANASTHASTSPRPEGPTGPVLEIVRILAARFPHFIGALGQILSGSSAPLGDPEVQAAVAAEMAPLQQIWTQFRETWPDTAISDFSLGVTYRSENLKPWSIHHSGVYHFGPKPLAPKPPSLALPLVFAEAWAQHGLEGLATAVDAARKHTETVRTEADEFQAILQYAKTLWNARKSAAADSGSSQASPS